MKIDFKDVMIDLETLGTVPGCAIASIGAIAFNEFEVANDGFYRTIIIPNWETPGVTPEGLNKDEGTIKWWQKQTPEAQAVFRDAHYSTRRALAELAVFLNEHDKPRVWGNGADFDLPIVTAAAHVVGLDPKMIWEPYNGRCYRTVKQQFRDIKIDRTNGTHHNALDDARAQAYHMVGLCRMRGWRLT